MRDRSLRRKWACCGALALAFAGCSAKRDDTGAPPPTPTGADDAGVPPPSGDAGPADEFTRALTTDLEQQGFLVSQGYTILYQADDCERFTYAATKNCYLNNPAAPYVALVVKPWPDEHQDPAVANVMGGVVPGHTGVYRLDRREAIVVYGRLPPKGKYFGLQTWVYSQQGRWSQQDYDFWAHKPNLVVPIQYVFDTLPPEDPSATRVQSFSAISNVVNNVVIERQSGSSFGQIRYFVITPDDTMNEAVRSALAGAGVNERDVFTEQVPQRDELGAIPIGLGSEASDFVSVFRYAVPEDPAAGQAWRNERPFTVLRVRAREGTPRPYPLFTPDPRTAIDELGNEQLTTDFANLIRSVCDRAQGTQWNLEGSGCEQTPPPSSLMIDPVRDYGWTGTYCRSVGMDCLGDQQESAYFFGPPQPLDDGEIYAVVGTLGTKTGNATYTAVSVNNPAVLKGAANLLDSTLEGSASAYGGTVKDPNTFFVWYFARDCNAIVGLTDGKCTPITPEMVPLRNDTAAMGDPALKGMLQLGLRHYVKPGTARGPDSTKLITPRVLKFTRRR